MQDLNTAINTEEANLDAALDDLLNDPLLADADDAPEIIEPSAAEIEAAATSLEAAEATQALYAEQGSAAPTDATPPTEAAPTETKPAKKVRASKKVKKDDAEATTEPKKPAEPRVSYVTHSKSEVLKHKLGDNAGDYMLLEVPEGEPDAAELQAKVDEVLASIDACGQKKVQEKCVILFSWMKNGGTLNEVMKRAFKVLARDGEITTGDKGNLIGELLSKPYSPGTARAQAGQIVSLFPMLKITTKEKGKLVANPNSMILMKAKTDFGF